MARMTLAELIGGNKVGWQALTPFFQSIGLNEYREASGNNEGGEQVYSEAPTAEAMQRAAGYTFDWNNDGPANTGALTAYDPNGQPVGSYRQQDKTAGQTLANWAKVAAIAAGGLGAIGVGPLAGVMGGAGSAGAGIGEAAAAGAGDAWGAAMADSLSGFGLQNVGALGAEAGTVGGGITGTLGGAGAAVGAAAGAAAPAAAGAGLWSSLISAGAPLIGSFITAGAQRTAGNTAADASVAASNAGIAQQNQQFAAIQKLLQPYVTAGTGALNGQQNLIGINGAAPQQSAIDAIKASPAFTSMQTLGENRILANASATGGLRGGNVQGALAQFSPQLLAQLIDQQYTRLGGISQQGQNAAAGVGTAGLNTGNQITQLLGQVGQAQGGAALSQGQATSTLANGFAGAAGQFVGSGGVKSIQPFLNNLGGLF